MNREDKRDSLLKDGEISKHWVDTGGGVGFYDVTGLLKAQLDKVLNPEWKDKPDSEGWWICYTGYCEDFVCKILIKNNTVYEERGYDIPPLEILRIHSAAKWVKVFIPEVEKE